ncbi:hypothetical protein SESBI_12020 [Sesbania bispinosa]|nr:hypothetical protein SESBI_12020 [Sesbania bispinosa]
MKSAFPNNISPAGKHNSVMERSETRLFGMWHDATGSSSDGAIFQSDRMEGMGVAQSRHCWTWETMARPWKSFSGGI